MFDPPPEMHERFDAALENTRANTGQDHGHLVDGNDVVTGDLHDDLSPINTGWVLGRFPEASPDVVDAAVAAAKNAFPGWRDTKSEERIRILRKVGELIEERVYDISAAIALEVGKNRMEAIGEVQETAEFFYQYCDIFESRQGFVEQLPDDPVPGVYMRNRSVMKPYGAWAVIAPFNFPFALAGGPAAAALVTGNTVVIKGAPDTPWAVRQLAECMRDAGVPAGAVNYLADPTDVAGPVLVDHPDVAGITFTGSHDVGMEICRKAYAGPYPKPCITEMGGKNAAIVTAAGNLDDAAIGIMRSAFGLSGQKCSALSRVYVEESVADALIEKLKPVVDAITVGDPTEQDNYIGPVGNQEAYKNYQAYVADLDIDGATFLSGNGILTEGELSRGFFCSPTVVEAPLDHPLWRHEMFVPIVMIARVPDKETGLELANDTTLGLTAGFYGDKEETDWFLDNIEAGVVYTNRPQGATTGAWPGYQRFGGWKGSGNTGKGFASGYYLSHYLREQSQTIVE
ncbi:MAG: aldehyde dehydrogenase family protein [Gammaproteobacteria bacterium]|nr:aldehyde dehydrogenase family protein [Gammaproteobacteria bacterium]